MQADCIAASLQGILDSFASWSLQLLYGVWSLAVILLALACRWFAALEQRRRDSRWPACP